MSQLGDSTDHPEPVIEPSSGGATTVDIAARALRDDGIGLAADFDLTKSKGLGMQIITALAKQLSAVITRTTQGEGNEFVVSVPCE
ncbi:MAG: hypothetical protein WB713_12845 [Methyloceanibacter sp.]